MTIAFVGSDSLMSGGTGSVTITLPAAAIATNNALLIFGSNASGATFNIDRSGWVLDRGGDVGNSAFYVYKKLLTSTDIANKTITISTAATTTQKITAMVAVFSGLKQINNFINISARTAETVSRATHTTPSVTTTVASTRVVQIVMDKASRTTAWTLPAGERLLAAAYPSTDGACSIVLTDGNADVPVGTYGNKTFTSNIASANAAMYTIALEPAPAGTVAPPAKFGFAENIVLDGYVAKTATSTVSWQHLAGTGESQIPIDTTDPWRPTLLRPYEYKKDIVIRMTVTESGLSTVYEKTIRATDYLRGGRLDERGVLVV